VTALDPYHTLGISRTAPAEEIERAYRSRAQAEHPDRGGDGERMANINRAREILSAAGFSDPVLDGVRSLIAGKSLNDIRVLRDELAAQVKSFEQRGVTGYGGPLKSPLLARRRREVSYLNYLLSAKGELTVSSTNVSSVSSTDVSTDNPLHKLIKESVDGKSPAEIAQMRKDIHAHIRGVEPHLMGGAIARRFGAHGGRDQPQTAEQQAARIERHKAEIAYLDELLESLDPVLAAQARAGI
jgi:hypothetical protein